MIDRRSVTVGRAWRAGIVPGLAFVLSCALGSAARAEAPVAAVAAPDCAPLFRRGDSNQDGGFDLSDGISTLGWLFLGKAEPGCLDAADANDSGRVDLADAIYSFTSLFLGGPPPPGPGFEECGIDPSDDGLDCRLYAACADAGCRDASCCPPGEYCAKPAGSCDSDGVCEPRPVACPKVFDPVCGCDGKTYGNQCEAAAAGVSVDHPGECAVSGCAASGECPPDHYCRKPTGSCDADGVCEPRPAACPEVFDPVCGCDGKTYGNDCEAAAAGVSVDHPGECGSTPCDSLTDCPKGAYCAKAEGDCAGVGTCQPRPDACPRIFAPVCGCDGQTYPNDCEAARHGVSVDHAGECVPTACTANVECPDGSYCAKAPGDCGGEGACEEKPAACPMIFDPVCGCDGKTYGNSCEAAAAGVSVAARGECPQ